MSLKKPLGELQRITTDMKQLHTEININAPAKTVWDILTDFDQYPDWNPFIRSVTGDVREGGRLIVVLQPSGGKRMTFKPRCLRYSPNKEFRWLGNLFVSGLFDGEHIFELNEISDGVTKLVQRENFKGILVPLFWKQLNTQTRVGFESMNEKLKALVEKKS